MWLELLLCVEHYTDCGRSPKGTMRRRALNAPDPPQSNKHSLLQLYVRGPVAPLNWRHTVGAHNSEITFKADGRLHET